MPRSRPSPIRQVVIATVCCGLASCAGLPKVTQDTVSKPIWNTNNTTLAQAVRPFATAHPGQSGVHPLPDGSQALDARLSLAGMAERCIDAQYYIWHSDRSGKRLIQEFLRAADRGVRVRVLLDDIGAAATDDGLLALDSHPCIEVRLFNPVATRSARLLGTLLDFGRVNRRMHNKAFVADNQIAIVGGRNIGDEYFDAHSDTNFADLDVAAVGPVVHEVSQSFDLYWNNPSSVPITALSRKRPAPEEIASRRAQLAATTTTDRDDPFASRLETGRVPFLPGRAWALYDDPAKVIDAPTDTTTHLAPRLRSILDESRREVVIVSPYFVPGDRGVELLTSLRRRGTRVVVLTNALASTDVDAVHAGYQRYRKPLLRAGIELYEAKSVGGWAPAGGFLGSRRASLHAKTFTFDRRTVFIGSMNLDPRSIRLNTEIGILIDCPELAAPVAESIQRNLERNAYRVQLEGRRLVWTTVHDGKPVRLTSEPGASAWKRMKVSMLSWLPIEGQL